MILLSELSIIFVPSASKIVSFCAVPVNTCLVKKKLYAKGDKRTSISP